MQDVPPAMIEWQASQPPDPAASAQWRRALEAAQRFVGLLAERGVPLLAGSDVPCGAVPPGLSLWRELALLVEAGLSPAQALRAATSGAAAFMGQDQLGRLRPGSAADLVMVRGNPLERIPERPEVVMVMRQGKIFRLADLRAASAAAAATMAEEPWGLQLEIQRPGMK
jgi:imidazolonepropionase-like amidohydrolase